MEVLKKIYLFTLLLAVLVFWDSCDNCDCVNFNSGYGTADKRLYFTAQALNSNFSSVFLFVEEDYKLEKIADSAQIFSPASQDEKFVVFSQENNINKVILKNLFDTTKTVIAQKNSMYFGKPVISQDGDKVLYYSENELYLWKLNSITGGAHLELLTNVFANKMLPAFSNNDKYIAFAEKTDDETLSVKIVETERLENIVWQKQIYQNYKLDQKIQWLDRENTLYFVLNDTTVCQYLVDNFEEKLIKIPDAKNLGVISSSISRDKKYIAFVSLQNELWIKNIQSGGFFRIIENNNKNKRLIAPCWNWDNKKLCILVNEDFRKNSFWNLHCLELDFQNNIPKINYNTLIFNNVINVFWGV